jgi:uncharacterized protein (DUF427 family)
VTLSRGYHKSSAPRARTATDRAERLRTILAVHESFRGRVEIASEHERKPYSGLKIRTVSVRVRLGARCFRNPYVRVDALRSHRHIRVELDGILLAETASRCCCSRRAYPRGTTSIGPTSRSNISKPSDTRTLCPDKGVTSQYWSVRIGETLHTYLVWAYNTPLPAVAPIARSGRLRKREARYLRRWSELPRTAHPLLLNRVSAAGNRRCAGEVPCVAQSRW